METKDAVIVIAAAILKAAGHADAVAQAQAIVEEVAGPGERRAASREDIVPLLP